MPAGSYQEYLQSLASVSDRYGAPLLDLNSSGKFSDSDFSDTCHMQASGGKKLLDLVSGEIARNPEIAQRLQRLPSGGDLKPGGREQTCHLRPYNLLS